MTDQIDVAASEEARIERERTERRKTARIFDALVGLGGVLQIRAQMDQAVNRSKRQLLDAAAEIDGEMGEMLVVTSQTPMEVVRHGQDVRSEIARATTFYATGVTHDSSLGFCFDNSSNGNFLIVPTDDVGRIGLGTGHTDDLRDPAKNYWL